MQISLSPFIDEATKIWVSTFGYGSYPRLLELELGSSDVSPSHWVNTTLSCTNHQARLPPVSALPTYASFMAHITVSWCFPVESEFFKGLHFILCILGIQNRVCRLLINGTVTWELALHVDRSWYFTIINSWGYVFSDKKRDPVELGHLPRFSTPIKWQMGFGPKSVSQSQALCIIPRNNGVWSRKWQVPAGTIFETPWDLGKESPLARKIPWHIYPPGLSNNIWVSPRAVPPAHFPVGVHPWQCTIPFCHETWEP